MLIHAHFCSGENGISILGLIKRKILLVWSLTKVRSLHLTQKAGPAKECWKCKNLGNIWERLGENLPITSVQVADILVVNQLLITQHSESNPFPNSSMLNK